MTAKIIVIVGVSVGTVIAMFIGGWFLDRSSANSKNSSHAN